MARKGNEPPEKRGGGFPKAANNAIGQQKRAYVKPETVRMGATERGYSMALAKAVLGTEQRIRNNKDESLHIFDKNGKEVILFQGKGAGVKGTKEDFAKIPPNSIITHNHPRSIGKTGIQRIGYSFSFEDVRTAIQTNAKEMRAVTPTYTFSLKRPKGGWPKDVIQFVDDYQRASAKVSDSNWKYINNGGAQYETRRQRAAVTHFHRIWKELTKKYKFDYTKKKG